MTRDFVPISDDAKATCAKNIEETIDEQAAIIGMDKNQVADVKNHCSTIRNSVASIASAETFLKETRTSARAGISTAVTGLRGIFNEAKNKTSFVESAGHRLGIIGTGSDFVADEARPDLKATIFPGHVTLRFTKKGVEGVNVYARLKGQSTWGKLAFDSHSPYFDNRPLAIAGTPEHREYMAIGVYHDAEVGQQSDIVEAVFGG